MIRRANSLKDNEIIYDLVEKAFEVEVGNTGLAFRSQNRYAHLKPNEEMFLKELEQFYVYEENAKVLACLKVVCENNVVDIGPLAVEPKHQGHGVGTKLLEFAETFAPVQTLCVAECRTDLIPFYERRGFKEIARSPITQCYCVNGRIDRVDLQVIHFEKVTSKD